MPSTNVTITALVFREGTVRFSAPVQLDSPALTVRSIQTRVRVSTVLVEVFVPLQRMASTPVSVKVGVFDLTLSDLY